MIHGLDVSSYQPRIDWAKVKNWASFVFIKASEFHKDPCFDSHWAGSEGSGLVRGAYHFFHPTLDPVAQARLLVSSVGQLETMDLPLAMDWETTDGLPSQVDVKNGQVFLQELRELTGKTPIIYGSPYFLNTLQMNSDFAQYPLWVAHYGVSKPLVPAPWPYWTFWQMSNTAYPAGIDGACDIDVFNGTLVQLFKLATGT